MFWSNFFNGFLFMHHINMIPLVQFQIFHDLWKFSKLGFMCPWKIEFFCSIGWNWLKLTLLVDRLIAYNMFPNCCDDQLVNWCDFWKIRVYVLQILGILHKTWFFGLTFQNYGKLSISMHSFMLHVSQCFMYHVVFQDCIYTSCISL